MNKIICKDYALCPLIEVELNSRGLSMDLLYSKLDQALFNQLKEFFDIEGPKSKFVLDKEYASNVLKELTPLLGREYKAKQGEEEIALVKDDVLTLLYCFDGTPSLPERIINGKNFYVALESKSYGTIVVLNYELINHYLELQK